MDVAIAAVSSVYPVRLPAQPAFSNPFVSPLSIVYGIFSLRRIWLR